MKTKVENRIEYRLENNIWYPNLKMKEEGIVLGRYGMMRKHFLEQNYKYRFEIFLIKGELFTHCKDIEEKANEMKENIIKQCMQKDINIIQAHDIAEEMVQHDLVLVKI